MWSAGIRPSGAPGRPGPACQAWAAEPVAVRPVPEDACFVWLWRVRFLGSPEFASWAGASALRGGPEFRKTSGFLTSLPWLLHFRRLPRAARKQERGRVPGITFTLKKREKTAFLLSSPLLAPPPLLLHSSQPWPVWVIASLCVPVGGNAWIQLPRSSQELSITCNQEVKGNFGKSIILCLKIDIIEGNNSQPLKASNSK